MKRYESSYCTFGVPDDWEPQPPFGFAAPGEEEDRMSAQALERWLDQPTAASAWAEKEKEILPHLLDGFELLEEGALPLRHSTGDAYFLSYRMTNEDAEPIVAKKIYLTQGPLLVDFTLSRPEPEEPGSARLLEGIASTLKLQGVGFMERYRPFVLFASNGDSGIEVEAVGERRAFPRCCVSVPALAGWELSEDDGDAVFRRSGAEIWLHRPVGIDPDAEVWLADRMQWAQATQSFLFGSTRGELENGAPYTAVVYEQHGETRRWKTAAVQRTLEVFVEDQQPLVWSLRASESVFQLHLSAFEGLIPSAEFLDPAEWETRLPEPWIDLSLRGGWKSQGPGVYFNLDDELILQTNREVSKAPLADLRPSLIESLRGSVDTKRDYEEDERSTKWRGADSLKYSLDGSASTGEPLSLRSICCTQSESVFSVVVLGRDPQGAEQQFAPVANALHFPR